MEQPQLLRGAGRRAAAGAPQLLLLPLVPLLHLAQVLDELRGARLGGGRARQPRAREEALQRRILLRLPSARGVKQLLPQVRQDGLALGQGLGGGAGRGEELGTSQRPGAEFDRGANGRIMAAWTSDSLTLNAGPSGRAVAAASSRSSRALADAGPARGWEASGWHGVHATAPHRSLSPHLASRGSLQRWPPGCASGPPYCPQPRPEL